MRVCFFTTQRTVFASRGRDSGKFDPRIVSHPTMEENIPQEDYLPIYLVGSSSTVLKRVEQKSP